MDAIPVASQVKSLAQFVAGDNEGAKQTQENFSRQCIVVSQTRSLVEAAKGDTKAARETQKQFLTMVDNSVSAIPVVGHVKGGIHYATGNKAKGHEAMKASSRTTGVMLGGAAGFVLAGPPGAVAGGVAGGTTMDGVITGADSARHKEFRPHGHFNIVQDPKNPGKWCDVVGGVAIDGFTGRGAGAAVGNITPVIKNRINHSGPQPPSWKSHTARTVVDATIPQDVGTGVLATVPEQNDSPKEIIE